jgi:hypothetical protein
LTLLCGLALTAGWSPAADEPKPGTAAGQYLPGPFQAYNLTGEHKGKYHCLVCEFGLNPTALIFARQPTDALGKLVKKLDDAVVQDQNGALRAGVVFLLSPSDLANAKARSDAEMKITDWAKGLDLKRVLVACFEEPAGPPQYEIDPDAEVLVVVYTRLKVVKNYPFKREALTEKDIDAIAAEFAKLSPKKK